MSFLRVPSLPMLKAQHSFNRLRSFHLVAGQGIVLPGLTEERRVLELTPQANVGGTISDSPCHDQEPAKISRKVTPLRPRTVNGVVPIPKVFYFGLAILMSVLFVLIIPGTFRGIDAGKPFFKHILDDVAQTSPGIVLLGENVDIDVDEPSITIRWSILACGQDYILDGSAGTHGCKLCGLPNAPLLIYVDGDSEPTANYDPSSIPFDGETGERRSIQNLVQFDSDHTLDVHNDRLYPFDTYFLSSTLRVTSPLNISIPISKLATIELTSSFVVETVDIQSYGSRLNDTHIPSRDIDMRVRRPTEARVITLLLFAVSWFLTHLCIGHVVLARQIAAVTPILKLLISNGVILFGLPQIRNSMPDAPGLDGVLIDAIGFFPQMIISGFCFVVLLLVVVARELELSETRVSLGQKPGSSIVLAANSLDRRSLSRRVLSRTFRPPPIPSVQSTSKDVAQYDLHRITKHLKGQYVFPPLKSSLALSEEGRSPTPPSSPTHRRFNTTGVTMGRIKEEDATS